MAIAILLSTAGNACLTLIPDAPLINDVLYLAAYPFLSVAAVLLIRARGRRISPAVWLDGLVVGLGAVAVVATLVLAPLLRPEPPPSTQTVTEPAYPGADLTLLTVLVAVEALPGSGSICAWRCSGWDLDSRSPPTSPTCSSTWPASYHEGEPVDVGWLLALLPIAAAACLPGQARQSHTSLHTGPIEHTTIAAPTVAGLAALAVLVSAVLLGEYHLALPLASGALAAACILVALRRTAFTLHQLKALPEARRAARTDPLTDLANRRHLQEWCSRLLARSDAAPVTLLMIDLDGFKIVNDRHGHPVGDALLVEVANRFATTMRHDDLLARLGGDEFAAVLPRNDTGPGRKGRAADAHDPGHAGRSSRPRVPGKRQRRHQRSRTARHEHRNPAPGSRHRHVPG